MRFSYLSEDQSASFYPTIEIRKDLASKLRMIYLQVMKLMIDFVEQYALADPEVAKETQWR